MSRTRPVITICPRSAYEPHVTNWWFKKKKLRSVLVHCVTNYWLEKTRPVIHISYHSHTRWPRSIIAYLFISTAKASGLSGSMVSSLGHGISTSILSRFCSLPCKNSDVPTSSWFLILCIVLVWPSHCFYAVKDLDVANRWLHYLLHG